MPILPYPPNPFENPKRSEAEDMIDKHSENIRRMLQNLSQANNKPSQPVDLSKAKDAFLENLARGNFDLPENADILRNWFDIKEKQDLFQNAVLAATGLSNHPRKEEFLRAAYQLAVDDCNSRNFLRNVLRLLGRFSKVGVICLRQSIQVRQ